jgi:hypothetical protein
MTMGEAMYSPFGQSLRELEARSGEVPPGWRGAYYDALRRLHAVRCEQRETIRLIGPSLGASSMMILHASQDVVIDGITERLERKTSGICEVCGKVGIARSRQLARVLCARCAVPGELQCDLFDFLNKMNRFERSGEPVSMSFFEIPVTVRAIIPESVWRSLSGPRGRVQCNYVLMAELVRYRPRFEALMRKAEQLAVRRKELEAE